MHRHLKVTLSPSWVLRCVTVAGTQEYVLIMHNDTAGLHFICFYVYLLLFLDLYNISVRHWKDGSIVSQETAAILKSALIYSTRVSVLCFTVMVLAWVSPYS